MYLFEKAQVIEVYTDKKNNYRFSLKAKSGNILLNSINFDSKSQMEAAIKNLGTITVIRSHFERKTNNTGQFLFNLKDDSGILIGQSLLYDSEVGMENGIKNLRNRLEAIRGGDDLKFVKNP